MDNYIDHISLLTYVRGLIMDAIRQFFQESEIYACGIDSDKYILSYSNYQLSCRNTARVAQHYNAFVVTNDSDFFLLHVRGIIFIDNLIRASSNMKMHPLRIYQTSLILKHTGLTETGFFYVCMLQTNDYITYTKPSPEEISTSISHNIPLAVQYVKSLPHDSSMKTYIADFQRKHPHKSKGMNALIQKYSTMKYPVGCERFIHTNEKEARKLMTIYGIQKCNENIEWMVYL